MLQSRFYELNINYSLTDNNPSIRVCVYTPILKIKKFYYTNFHQLYFFILILISSFLYTHFHTPIVYTQFNTYTFSK
jgi:hypothetical protein